MAYTVLAVMELKDESLTATLARDLQLDWHVNPSIEFSNMSGLICVECM